MSREPLDRESLEEAVMAWAATAAPGKDCPAPETLWEVALGEAPLQLRRRVVDHMSTCEACSQAWRLALELTAETERQPATRAARMPGPRWQPLALAATVVLALGVSLVVRHVYSPPSIERGEDVAIESLTGSGPLPRGTPARLAWTPGPEGTLYDVVVTTEDLEVLTRAAGLSEARLVLSTSELARVPAGETILWWVEASLPDGTRRVSPIFTARLE